MYENSNPIISFNNISKGISISTSGNPQIYGNKIIPDPNQYIEGTRVGINGASYGDIFENVISGWDYGLYILGAKSIMSNTVSNCKTGIYLQGTVMVEQNLVHDNDVGVLLRFGGALTNNTVIDNSNGIVVQGDERTTSSQTFEGNNIYGNAQYNVKSGIADNITAINNWWGTTDVQSINMSIFDSKRDFNLGTVTFIPFLNELNFLAMPNNSPTSLPLISPPAPTPTLRPSQSPATTESSANPTTTQSKSSGTSHEIIEFLAWSGVLVILVGVIVGIIALRGIKHKASKPDTPALT